MKEQILPALPIVGKLKLTSRDGLHLCGISVTQEAPSPELAPLFELCLKELEAYFMGELKEFTIPLDLSEVTPFQRKVLEEMKKIPYGQTATYKDLARGMDSMGYQAIGTACGRNPFMIIYPCHRVLSSGGMGGFAHGLPMKKALLALERDSLG